MTFEVLSIKNAKIESLEAEVEALRAQLAEVTRERDKFEATCKLGLEYQEELKAEHREQLLAAPAQGQEADRKDAAFINSHEFNDTARAALLWVLYHYQGGSSSVGQPIRFALGMGQYDRLSNEQISMAKLWAELSGDGLP